jgi:hypothetical protein
MVVVWGAKIYLSHIFLLWAREIEKMNNVISHHRLKNNYLNPKI